MSTTVVLANDHRTAQLENHKLARELVELRRENDQLRAELARVRVGAPASIEAGPAPRFARQGQAATPPIAPIAPIITNRDGTTVQVIARPQHGQAPARSAQAAPEPGTIIRNADGSTVQFLGRSLSPHLARGGVQAPRVEEIRRPRVVVRDEGQDDGAEIRSQLLELE